MLQKSKIKNEEAKSDEEDVREKGEEMRMEHDLSPRPSQMGRGLVA
jgi:hypothetical protein